MFILLTSLIYYPNSGYTQCTMIEMIRLQYLGFRCHTGIQFLHGQELVVSHCGNHMSNQLCCLPAQYDRSGNKQVWWLNATYNRGFTTGNVILWKLYQSFHFTIRWSETFEHRRESQVIACRVEPLLSDLLLSEFSVIQPQTHSPNSIEACYFSLPVILPFYYPT